MSRAAQLSSQESSPAMLQGKQGVSLNPRRSGGGLPPCIAARRPGAERPDRAGAQGAVSLVSRASFRIPCDPRAKKQARQVSRRPEDKQATKYPGYYTGLYAQWNGRAGSARNASKVRESVDPAQRAGGGLSPLHVMLDQRRSWASVSEGMRWQLPAFLWPAVRRGEK